MKTIASLNIRRKLASFGSVFPHDDNAAVKNITGIYNDVLRFSRPGLYSESVTRAAWKLLLLQIGNGTTSHLIQALGKCPLIEVQVFLSTLMTTCMSDVEDLNDALNRKERTVMLPSSSKEVQLLVPVLDFISRFATQSDSTCQTVINAGILNMLLRIYVIFPTLSDSTREGSDGKLALQDACRLTIRVLGQSQHQEAVFNHPVCILWTDCHSQPPGYTVDAPTDPVQDRCGAWRRVEKSCVMRRAVVIYRYTLWKPDADSDVDMEACIDIVEFTRCQFYESAIVEFACLSMLRNIVLSGDSALDLMNVLARGSREDTDNVFSGVIRLWLDCINMQVQSDDKYRMGYTNVIIGHHSDGVTGELPPIEIDGSLYDTEKNRLGLKMVDTDSALHNIIKFTTKAAEQTTSVRLGLLDAGSLALVLTAFANADFRLSSLTSAPGKEGKGKGAKSGRNVISDEKAPPRLSSTAINAEASALSVSIHTAKFIKPWRGQRLDTRLSLCSSLVDGLLGKDEVLDDEHEVTRALFRNIVNVANS